MDNKQAVEQPVCLHRALFEVYHESLIALLATAPIKFKPDSTRRSTILAWTT